jgi:hypothetical protein
MSNTKYQFTLASRSQMPSVGPPNKETLHHKPTSVSTTHIGFRSETAYQQMKNWQSENEINRTSNLSTVSVGNKP